MNRKIKRNNPGNVRPSRAFRWVGETTPPEARYCHFDTIENGCRAMIKLLLVYMNKHHLRTVEDIVRRWAPPDDNNFTETYIEVVCNLTGFKRDEVIEQSANALALLACSMTKVEHGRKTEIDCSIFEKEYLKLTV